MLKGDGKNHAVCKIQIAPADLIKLFGTPEPSEIFYQGTGQYTFEDNNLDMYCLFDYKQTDFYYGINREDEYYTTNKNLKLPLHARKQKYPTIQEFWESTEPRTFKLAADDQADWRKFRRWLRIQLKSLKPEDKSFFEKHNIKFVDDINLCHGKWDEKAKFCQDVLAMQYDFTYHMTPEELKAYKGPMPEKLKSPVQFDLKRASRVVLNKDAIKLAEMEKEAAKMKEV